VIDTSRRKLLDAGATQELNVPDALPASVFAEAVVDERAMAASGAEHLAIIIDLPRGKRVGIFAAASPAPYSAALEAQR